MVYDVDQQRVVDTIGGKETFPKPGGDTALSPDGRCIANGWRQGVENKYVIFRRSDRSSIHTRGFRHPGYTEGDLRVDGSPCWNRTSDRILFPAIAPDGTRQIFVLTIRPLKGR